MKCLFTKAVRFAAKAHEGQKRKYTGEPYILHPLAVAEIVRGVAPEHVELHVAAICHDVVEDTSFDIDDIDYRFGHNVACMVYDLTDISKPEDGNRAERIKAIDREHLSRGSADSKTIKLADLIHNTASIVKHDADFAKVYMEEKSLLLDVLGEGNITLLCRARVQVDDYFQKEMMV